MKNNYKNIIKNKIQSLLETKGFEHMEVAFGVKHKSDNLSDAEKKQFGSMESVQDKETGVVNLGLPKAASALKTTQNKSNEESEEYYKEASDRVKDYQKPNQKASQSRIGESFEPKKVNRKDDQMGSNDVYDTEALGVGMHALRYDNEGTPVFDQFMKRQDDLNGNDSTYKKLSDYSRKYLKHKYGEPDEYHYTPKVRTTEKSITEGMFGDNFDDVPTSRSLIDTWFEDGNMEAIQKYISGLDGIEKEDAENYLKGKKGETNNLRETYSDVIKENIFKVKGDIKSKEQVLKVSNKVPSRVKMDETVFAITDGKNYYRLIWEGDRNGEAVITHEKNTKVVNENIEKMKHLWNYNASDVNTTKNIVKETEEDKFKKMFRQLKNK